VNNHVDEPEVVDEAVPAADLAGQEETKSDNNEKKNAEPSTVTPTERTLQGHLSQKPLVRRD
jgi:hypothetical protein